MFRKVLVANRGEIAVRVLRALREREIPSVAVYSDADRTALHVRMADEAAHLGPPPAAESYLHIERIIAAAKERGADAIHPGYGFLSENGAFAEACESAGIAFIGPSAHSIRLMGSKPEARRLAMREGVLVVPGTQEPVRSLEEAREVAAALGYPVLLKAAAGGGGKGMRQVEDERGLAGAFRDASSEAERAFRNGDVYLEKALENPRHIEIQIIGDKHGNLIHLGERECSLQRRHQKVVEECPSSLVARYPQMRERMGEAALRVARAARYFNAGTVEFLVDPAGNFYFLEMNTRLQVEHPVTEMVTGVDLVHLQLDVAAGRPLLLRQEDIRWHGWALECRIYAEDPHNNFFPSPGRVTRLDRPSGPGVRLDSGIYLGWTVPLEYDPLLAKLVTWASTRDEAVSRMIRALAEHSVGGIKTTIGFFTRILTDPGFRAGDIHTGFIDEFLRRQGAPVEREPQYEAVVALVAALHLQRERADAAPAASNHLRSNWALTGRQGMMR